MTTKLHNLLRASTPLQLKLARASEGLIEGYASTFGGEPDAYGHVIAPGAFSNSLAKHKADGGAPAMLWSHDPSRPIGRWTALAEDSKGLLVEGQLNRDTAAGADAFAHLKAGDVTGLSIGFTIEPSGYRQEADGVLTLLEIDLWEISAVVFPANRRARVTGVKSIASQRELEDLLHHELCVSRSAAKKLASGGWRALANTEQTNSQTIADLLRKSAAQLKGN